jgi:PAS domain S-box-containing protein
MKKEEKSKNQIVKELRQRIAELEKSEMEHKKGEEALKKEKEHYRSFVESLSDWAWEMDINGVHIYSNSTVENLLGYRVDEVVGHHVTELWLDEDKTQETLKWLQETLTAGKGWKNFYGRFKHKNGSIVITESTAIPIFDSGNKLAGYKGIDRDITKRNKAEDLLKKQKEELSEFAHTVSHALKNYIGIIRICAQFLLLRRKYTEKYVQRIDDMVTKIDEFVTQQLQLANAGRVIGEPEEVDLNTVIDEVGKMYSIEIHPEELPTITGDPRRLREIFYNLIDNAIKHGEADSVEISSREEKDSYVICIKDNGSGIPEDEMDKIFDMGYSKNGTGLGLAIVKKIIEAHGGSISVKSEEEKGAVFELVLPIKM